MTTTETEAGFTRAVIELARLHGWRVAHFRTARIQRKAGSVYYATPVQADGTGFPDLVLVKRRGERRTLWIELKTDKGRLRPEQEEWLADLKAAGQEAYVFRPADWDEVVRVLSR